MKILFITSTRLGDAVLSTGLLDYMWREWPEGKVTVACGPLPASIFDGFPNVERVIALKKQKRNGHWIALWKQVATTRWDMVVDLRNSAVSRLILAKKRYVFGSRKGEALHKVEQAAYLMKLSTVPAPRLHFTKEQEAFAKAPRRRSNRSQSMAKRKLSSIWPPAFSQIARASSADRLPNSLTAFSLDTCFFLFRKCRLDRHARNLAQLPGQPPQLVRRGLDHQRDHRHALVAARQADARQNQLRVLAQHAVDRLDALTSLQNKPDKPDAPFHDLLLWNLTNLSKGGEPDALKAKRRAQQFVRILGKKLTTLSGAKRQQAEGLLEEMAENIKACDKALAM